MTWEQYERTLQSEWQALLESTPHEKALQQFLENHPCLVPGSRYPMTGSFPVRAALITQPGLQSTTRRVPDFMWLSNDSATLYPVLIEIERPSKRWFTSKAVPTATFTQAMSQLREWRAWFNERENQSKFMKGFDIPDHYDRGRFRPHCVLIYGRRAELETNQRLRRLRAMQEHPDESIMSFDRLRPLRDSVNYITIKRSQAGYEAVSVPPTLKLDPLYAPFWADIYSKQAAIQRCEWMTEERKAFLCERIEYWDDWARREDRGIIHVGDEE
jgi:Domain of unknown function (DUF4263)